MDDVERGGAAGAETSDVGVKMAVAMLGSAPLAMTSSMVATTRVWSTSPGTPAHGEHRLKNSG